ncbi:transposase family protein [Altericista sp. CCNU0014]|uniref:transposase family protein n=1 Tax=Altericista sp. CCNU0014 TaxID=3082949 RepID=UPI00384EC1ED
MDLHLDRLLNLPEMKVENCEQLDFVNWRRRYTQRYEAYIFQNVQYSSIEKVSREEGLTWDRVDGIFDLIGLKQ